MTLGSVLKRLRKSLFGPPPETPPLPNVTPGSFDAIVQMGVKPAQVRRNVEQKTRTVMKRTFAPEIERDIDSIMGNRGDRCD